jgi:DNA polymerase-1
VAKTLYLIDGHWQVYRAYYAPMRDLHGPGGEPTRATHVFCTWLMKLVGERRPDYLAMAMDCPPETLERTAIFPEYKAQREAPPEDLPPQTERIRQIVAAMGIPLLQQDGAEADDILATLARRFAAEGLQVVLVSRDKDLDQVLGPHVCLYDPTKDEVVDAESLERTKGYTPDKAVEIQALVGDKVDNIPGVPGIGPKTAAKLIGRYGSAEAVVRHADELTPKQAENVRAAAERVAMARRLVELNDRVDLDVSLEEMAFDPSDTAAARPIFEELGFKRLLEQTDAGAGNESDSSLNADAPPADAPPALHASADAGMAPAETAPSGMETAGDCEFECIDTPEALDRLVSELEGVGRLAVDTETTSLRPMRAALVGISLAWRPRHGVYVPVAGPLGARTLPVDLVRERLGPILANAGVEKVGQHIKYDKLILERAGFPLAGPLFDTMLAAYVLHADRGAFNLDSLAAEYLGYRCIPVKDLLGTGRTQRTMDAVPVELVAPYAAEDADVTGRLADVLAAKLEAEGLTGLFRDIEMALMPVLADMERTGIRVDPAELARQKADLAKRADILRDRILAAAGRPFNVDSPKQLAEILFTDLGLPVQKRRKTGPSTDVSVLTELAGLHEVPALVLEYRQITKLLGTYLEALGQCIHPDTRRVHTSFHQTGTATGRLSSSDPNLQNIPIRTELGRQIRTAFVADEGWRLVSADYSQVELRVLAHFCQDPTLMAAFHADQDIHRTVAAEVFGVSAEEVTPEQRARAKTVNFGIVYGQTAFGLARTLGIPRGEAQAFIDSYHRRFPRIEQFLGDCVAHAREHGFVRTISGRRRRIEGIDSRNAQRRALAERLAINSVVQGSAADLIKIAMIGLHRRLADENRPSRILLQIHDELLLETPAEAVDAECEAIVEEMTSAMELRVPLRVDVGVGENWREAK